MKVFNPLKFPAFLAVPLAIVVALLYFLGPSVFPKFDKRTRFLAAVLSKDKRAVFYIQRDIRAWIDSLAFDVDPWEHAKYRIRFTGDQKAIRKFELSTRQISTLQNLPDEPRSGPGYAGDLRDYEQTLPAEMGWSQSGDLEYYVIGRNGVVLANARKESGEPLRMQQWAYCQNPSDCINMNVDKDDADKLGPDLELVNLSGKSLFVLDRRTHTLQMVGGEQVSVSLGFASSRRVQIEQESRLRRLRLDILREGGRERFREQVQHSVRQRLTDGEVDRLAGLFAEQSAANQRIVEHTFTVVAKVISQRRVRMLISGKVLTGESAAVHGIYELPTSDFSRLWPSLREAIVYPGRQVDPPPRLDIQSRPCDATELNDFIWRKAISEQKAGSALVHFRNSHYQLNLIQTK